MKITQERLNDKMLATLLHGPGDLRLEVTDVPKIENPHDVIIKVLADGLCPTGVRAIDKGTIWGAPGIGFPGHEYAGVVVAVGSAVKNVKPGDRVVAENIIRCGQCYYCLTGRSNLCVNRTNTGWFSWAQYTKTLDYLVEKIPDHVSYEQAAFTEPLSTVLNSVEIADIQAGDEVVIVGSGPMGLLHLLVVRNFASSVIIVDTDRKRLEFAKNVLGADYIINPNEFSGEDHLINFIKSLTYSELGPNVVFLTVGAAPLVNLYLKVARPGGKVVLFGGFGDASLGSIDMNLIHYRQVSLVGAHDKTHLQFIKALKMISTRFYPIIDKLITHRFPLEKIHEAITVHKRREGLKIMILPNPGDLTRD
ncbi:alcohol dehydrogenase catalytic domain-containing protein [Infirmifilum sp.]|jgi:L-iditol 2-dehydrogenase|uniref:alcohol dehydrogenase catalytic domain-containing protein n=1 Tax=Infirmifilum sp. TaxID=2856575 RepID=UPI003D09AC5C